MPRRPREISNTGIYHIVFRGVNRQSIFEEKVDYEKFLLIIQELKKQMGFEIYAYCLMSNHVHIILKEKNVGEISLIMKRILTKYVMWYNFKYSRSGALIASRYKSKPVEVDEYFLPVIRYVHQNPLKANMVKNIEEYKWSSYYDYVSAQDELVDISFVLDMMDIYEFIEFHKQEDFSTYSVDDKMNITDDELRRIIVKKTGMKSVEIAALNREKRNEILSDLKKNYSIRQLERVTGISRGIIYKS